jgi:hypothetical protein
MKQNYLTGKPRPVAKELHFHIDAVGEKGYNKFYILIRRECI